MRVLRREFIISVSKSQFISCTCIHKDVIKHNLHEKLYVIKK